LTLVLVIIVLDQLVWRPVVAWADRFKLEMVSGDEPPRSWFFEALSRSWLLEQLGSQVLSPLSERLDGWMRRRFSQGYRPTDASAVARRPAFLARVLAAAAGLAVLYGSLRAALFLASLPGSQWADIGLGVLATFARVAIALGLTLLWTVPVGVAIGTNRRLAAVVQPVVQTVASIPATALFPVLLFFLLRAPNGLNLAAVLLMLMGTQWYMLFNVIAGASAIPLDLRYTTDLLRLSRAQRWKTLLLPALLPFLVTGGITASGGAWNASIVAEHVEFGGETYFTTGVGATIAQATGAADYRLLLASTLALIFSVVFINRTFWRWLYRLAEERFRME
jgi:NitT/TauT family transport system permease protein